MVRVLGSIREDVAVAEYTHETLVAHDDGKMVDLGPRHDLGRVVEAIVGADGKGTVDHEVL
jgi:hypothetical protein